MKQKFLVVIFLAILVMQPMVAFTGTFAASIEKPVRSYASAQDAGTRMGPGEHTNHVPFAINETADFVTQGWPGSGTELDPFVISGLNITMAGFDYCIRIRYTDAYFVIRDCFIKGESMSYAIDLANATHGRIEYATIISDSMAINALFCDNLFISHTYAEGIGMPFMFILCDESTLEWSVANCSAGIGVYVAASHYFTSAHNYAFTGSGGGYGIFFASCNYSSSSFDVAETDFATGYSFFATSCHYLSINDFTSITGAFGLLAIDCPSSNFTRGSVSNSGAIGVQFVGNPNMRFSDTTIYDSFAFGLLVASCNNSVLSNIDIEGAQLGLQFLDSDDSQIVNASIMTVTGGYGLYCDDSHDLVLDSISVEDISSTGVYLFQCDRPQITDVDVTNTGVSGINFEFSPNGSISDCDVNEAGSSGIHVDNSENTLIADCSAVDTFDAGIFTEYSDNVEIYRNYIADYGSYGIDVENLDDARVENNTLDGQSDMGIRSYYSDRTLVSRNTITTCNDGIYLYESDNGTITLNTVTDAEDMAVGVYASDMATVTNNSLISAYEEGIYVSNSVDSIFDYNTMIECGFYFVVGNAMNRYNHSMVGNTVNGKPVYYAYDDHHVVLDASLYGQIILLNSSYAEIAFGTFQRTTTAVELLYCDEGLIHNLDIYGDFHTIMIYSSDNVTVRDTNMQGRGDDYGIYSSYSDNLLIQNCSFSRFATANRYGIMLQGADYATITNCSFNYNNWGVRWSSTDNVTVSDCTILNSEQYGIYAWGSASQYALISGNTILNASRGFYSSDTSDGLITNNIIKYCSDDGINLGGGSGNDWNVTLNTVESNYYGINAWTSDNHFIMNNTVRWNDQYGIYAFGSTGTEVFYNVLALNGVRNGYDSRSGNYWDDDNSTGIPLGNWWHDYTPSGIYWVDGSGGDTDDRYPMQYLPTEPIINQPQDISFAEFSTGNELVWNPFDDSLRDWEVTVDGVFFTGDAWNFVDVTVILDELAYGVHEVVVTVWDVHGNNVTDTVIVNVYDDIDPNIDGPANTEAFVDATGQTLTWDVYDLHPGTYEIRVDDVVTESGTWTSGTISTNIDSIDAGVHAVYLWIYDLDWNSERDGVAIEVIDDDTAPTIDSPDDLSYIEGTIGNSIVWTPTDMYPAIYQISYNGSVLDSGEWGGSRVVADVDGLAAGTHVMRLTVYDGSGLSAYDEVRIVVTAVETEAPPLPVADPTLLLIVGAVAGAAIVVVVIIILLKKKQAA